MSASPGGALPRTSVVDALTDELRAQILEGSPAAGEPLREIELSERFGVSRHTLRAALRRLAAEGIVLLEPHRGARVASIGAEEMRGLWELRTALEVESVRLALERGEGRLPTEVHRAAARLTAASRRTRPSWRTVSDLHTAFHEALVDASGSDRIRAAYGLLAPELRLFVLQLRPAWSAERMAGHHEHLPEEIERDGAEALRRHLQDGFESVRAG